MSIRLQVHEKFKVFVGASISEIDEQVRAFTAGSGVAAKSIGVEFIDATEQLLVSLGYKVGEDGYPVKLVAKQLGAFDPSSTASITKLEGALEASAADTDHIICHELFVSSGTVTAVLLTLA